MSACDKNVLNLIAVGYAVIQRTPKRETFLRLLNLDVYELDQSLKNLEGWKLIVWTGKEMQSIRLTPRGVWEADNLE